MTIFIPEYIIYWSSCPNLFFIDYSPAYVFVVDTLFFDYDNYSILYKTGAFSKNGYVKYPKWIHYNFYKGKGIEILRARMCEKFFFYKKFGVRKIVYQELRYYKFVNFYYLESFNTKIFFLSLMVHWAYWTKLRPLLNILILILVIFLIVPSHGVSVKQL